MKNLVLVFCAFIFLGCSSSENANIAQNEKTFNELKISPTNPPADVLNVTSDDKKSVILQIKAFAKKQYPNDYKMQKFIYDQQMEAYDFMQRKNASDIKVFAGKQYPDDYNMQKFVFNQQTDAYNFMKKQPDSDIKAFAEKQYLEDYNMQKFVYEQQIEAKKEMDKK